MAKKKSIKLLIPVSILIAVFAVVGLFVTGAPEKVKSANSQGLTSFWDYKCIDTMKTSRDKARDWSYWTGLNKHIEMEMDAISDMGANCVAIDTPYDAEFLPYLEKWVQGARRQNLSIWFRGNWSSWEGWFDYPKGMSTASHLQKTENFILNNPDLFKDGDIFTAAPEAENGGPYNQVEPDEYSSYRAFLIQEYSTGKSAFDKIGKKVEVNWLSMNGGLAERMMDKNTISELGGVVAIDHYINDPKQMGEFINYFADKFGAKVIIGEFGAPIPDINGYMSEEEQANFIDELLHQMYLNESKVNGISYWDLYDGSTALVNLDNSPRKAFSVVKKYFTPGKISGSVVDEKIQGIKNVPVFVKEEGISLTTDKNGNFSIPLVQGKYTLIVGDSRSFNIISKKVNTKTGKTTNLDITLTQKNKGLIDNLRKFLRLN